jgi:hypothetical protein
MVFNEIVKLVEGTVVYDSGNCDADISVCCSSDLMSDILTLDNRGRAMLVTGLATVQALRTADMAEMNHVIIVREKEITQPMIELAKELGITLVRTRRPMFTVCGLMYNAGLNPPY